MATRPCDPVDQVKPQRVRESLRELVDFVLWFSTGRMSNRTARPKP
jgi:hypothetical protein